MKYRLIQIDGTLGPTRYEIVRNQSAIAIISDGKNDLRVYKKRLVPVVSDTDPIIINAKGKCLAACPKCEHIEIISSNTFECPTHGKFILQGRIGEKQMSKKKKKPFDIKTIKSHKSIRIFRKNSKFNHEKIGVESYVLLCDDRKYCFNVYNSSVGKLELYIDEFVDDTPIDGKKPWYTVKSIQAEVKKLARNGYEEI